MRIQAPDDDLLEPLPIFVDGIAIAPVSASTTPQAAARRHAHEILDATPAAIAQPLAVRTHSPLAGGEHPETPPARIASLVGAFTRMIELRAGLLDSLPDWWRQRVHDERVEIARRLLLEQPHLDRADTWRIPGSLRGPRHPRPIRVELLLWPHLEAWTKVRLEPQRGVRVGHRYFNNGHQVLDALCAELIHGLTPRAHAHTHPIPDQATAGLDHPSSRSTEPTT